MGASGATVDRRGFAGWMASGMLIACAFPAHAESQCEASDHGMRADGGDNVAALTRTLAECAGKTIHIPQGIYTFSPNGFAPGIKVPSGTSIVGDGSQGRHQTVLRIARSGNFQSLLWIRNVSNVSIRGLRFEGSAYESGCVRHLDYGHAIYVQSDAGQDVTVESLDLSGNAFYNFNGQSWVTINAADGSPGIGLSSSITIDENVFDSDANLSGGCAAGPMTDLAAMISIHGSNSSAQGLVKNVAVTSNTLNAAYVKEGVAIWSGTNRISVKGNAISDTGLRLPRPPGIDLGRYAILVYRSGREAELRPDTIWIVDNTITNPVSCGVYIAAGQNVQISGNRISGQIDRYDPTLPKAAIALNHAVNVFSLENNDLIDNYIGISSVGSSQLNLGTNRIVPAAGGIGAKIR